MMIAPVASPLIPYRAPRLVEEVSPGDTVQLSPAALAPVPATGLDLYTFQLRNSLGEPRGEPVDLAALTPDAVRQLSPEARQAFFDRLYEHSPPPIILDERGSQSNLMGLDRVVLLHLYRQDPSIAGLILESNPETVARLHGDLTSGPLSESQRAEANGFAQALLANLPEGLGAEQSHAIAAVAGQAMRANGHSPEAFGRLLEAADAGVSSDFNAGVVAGSLLAGVRDSGDAPLEFLDKLLPGSPTPLGMVSFLLRKAASRSTDTREEARSNYLQLYDIILEGLEEAGNLDQYRGFVQAGRWNA